MTGLAFFHLLKGIELSKYLDYLDDKTKLPLTTY